MRLLVENMEAMQGAGGQKDSLRTDLRGNMIKLKPESETFTVFKNGKQCMIDTFYIQMKFYLIYLSLVVIKCYHMLGGCQRRYICIVKRNLRFGLLLCVISGHRFLTDILIRLVRLFLFC